MDTDTAVALDTEGALDTEAGPAGGPVRFDTKLAVVLRDDLEVWQRLKDADRPRFAARHCNKKVKQIWHVQTVARRPETSGLLLQLKRMGSIADRTKHSTKNS